MSEAATNPHSLHRRGGFHIRPEALRLPLCPAGDQWSPLQGGYSVVVSDEDDTIPDVFSVEVGSKAGRVSL